MSEDQDFSEDDRCVRVLFGSQTGTAEDVAEHVGREIARRHVHAPVAPLDDYPIGKLVEENLVVFVISTTGQGDPPDNMKKFWKFVLRKNLPEDCLCGLHIAVIGLGDSSYLKFNFIAKKLYKRLLQLGATSFAPVALADEKHNLGLDGVIDPWLNDFLENLQEVYPLPVGKEIIPKHVLPVPRFVVNIVGENEDLKCSQEKLKVANGSTDAPFDRWNPLNTTIVSNERKTNPNHYQDVRLIAFDIQNANVEFSPGDVLMIKPKNIVEVVDEFFKIVPWSPLASIEVQSSVSGTNLPADIPPVTTLHRLFIDHLTLQAPPKRYFFQLLAHFTDSELEQERLDEFLTSGEGQEELFDYCYRLKRNYLEVLQDFPSACANLKLEYIFDLFPFMQPRSFSIASSYKAHPDRVEILMAVVQYKTKMFKPRRGVCSTWLASLEVGSPVQVWLVPGTVTFPRDPNIPVVMVGPEKITDLLACFIFHSFRSHQVIGDVGLHVFGTGVAPFRSYMEEEIHNNSKGEMVLFFGCRNKDGDDFFREEWDELTAQNKQLNIYTCYSRDQPQKIYVQHKIKEYAEKVWRLIHEASANFYIAGNSKDMPNDVIAALKDIFQEHGNMSEKEADDYFKELEMRRRFQCETWS